MLFERIECQGLAHFSYMVGDGHEALVVDPRRDAAVYEHLARSRHMRITTILETHRNEDYVVGSVELASRTGASIWHADGGLDYRYGEAVADGQQWRIGRLCVEAVATPGHTPGSFSYLVHGTGGRPWLVFSGDTLFAGDVGRVDLVDERSPQEMAALLYESLHARLLSLGDGVLVCPGHGAGSVCGHGIADRVITSIGIEREADPLLRMARDEFVEAVARRHHRPPYFRRIERLNLDGVALPDWFPVPPPLEPQLFAAAMTDAVVLDVRSEMAYAAAHVPGSVSVWSPRLAQFVGSLVPSGSRLLLVGEGEDVAEAARCLVRLGYDDVVGYLAGGLSAWLMDGRPTAATATTSVDHLCALLRDGSRPAILDVRTTGELQAGVPLPRATHIELVDLPGREAEVTDERPLYVVCGSGPRSMMAASLLERAGAPGVTVVLGGAMAWENISCALAPDA